MSDEEDLVGLVEATCGDCPEIHILMHSSKARIEVESRRGARIALDVMIASGCIEEEHRQAILLDIMKIDLPEEMTEGDLFCLTGFLATRWRYQQENNQEDDEPPD